MNYNEEIKQKVIEALTNALEQKEYAAAGSEESNRISHDIELLDKVYKGILEYERKLKNDEEEKFTKIKQDIIDEEESKKKETKEWTKIALDAVTWYILGLMECGGPITKRVFMAFRNRRK